MISQNIFFSKRLFFTANSIDVIDVTVLSRQIFCDFFCGR